MAVAAADYLEPEQAFQFSAALESPGQLTVRYQIADGYYMYRERFHFSAVGATLGNPAFPKGKVKFDETFKKEVETFRYEVVITIPVEHKGPFSLTATGQGCADAGLCYAPMDSEIKLGGGGVMAAVRSLNAGVNSSAAPAATGAAGTAPSSQLEQPTKNVSIASKTSLPSGPSDASGDTDADGRIQAALKGGRLLVIVPLFLLLGMGLALTPCVLPMMPILSSIIVGEGASVGRLRGFVLSLTYSLGMAIVYTAFGVAAGLVGHGLSAVLQNPWVLGGFALLMVALSLSMFGLYELQVPAALQERLTRASQRQRTGKLVGVFVMGALAALIVGPCVAAPLAGALVYLSQTHDVVIGGSALFALAMGMSVPLLLIGISAGTLLPRAGAWMGQVKRVFGVLMLAVAWWMVAPLLPPMITLGGWAALGIGAGAALVLIGRPARALQLIGIGMIVFGAVEAVGAATGASNVLAPLAQLGGHHRHAAFQRIASVAQLDAALRAEPRRVVMLDFYADWCTSCKEMESSTLIDPVVVQKLDTMLLLQADVTANNADDKALLKRFGLFGPPGILFFSQASEIPGARIIGYQDSRRFTASLARAVQGANAPVLPQ